MDSNHGSLILEVTALLTAPQPLSSTFFLQISIPDVGIRRGPPI